MARYEFTAALNAATFPLVTRFQPRPVVIGQLDGRLRDPSSSTTNNLDNNPQNIPQVLYCENVLPTDAGVRSIGYSDVQPAFPAAYVATKQDDVFILRDGDVSSWFFEPARGLNYVTTALGAPWVSTNPIAGAPLVTPPYVTLAYVNGFTYVCYENNVLLRWDGGAGFTDVSGSLIGITSTGIRAICGAGNYLIVIYADNSTKWSSLTDPLDFTPSTLTGAGSQIPLDIRGYPTALSPISGGFLIHCSENTVAAVYTQNAAQPWIFREVKNSGGIGDRWNDTARDMSTGFIYQFNKYGLQQLNLRDAETIHANLTEFVSSGVLETFDNTTNLLSITRDTFSRKISFLSGRFLCLSYGAVAESQFQYVLIYDVALRRWGKLKVDHIDIFTDTDVADVFDSVYVLKNDGVCTKVVIDLAATGSDGVIILGRYQLSRGYQICSQELELEVLDGSDIVTVDIAVNYNGTTVGQMNSMVLYESDDNYRKFQQQIEGSNLSYIIKGSFNLATALLTITKGARE